MTETFVDPSEPVNPHEPLKLFSLDNDSAYADVGSRNQRIFLDILQTIFGSDEILAGCPNNDYRWRPDENTNILIAHNHVENHQNKNPNHSILVNRGPIVTRPLSINNWNQPNLANSGGKFTVMFNTDLAIMCKSRKSKEANTIATLVYMNILMYRDVIRKRGRYEKVSNPTMGNEEVVKGQSDSEIKQTIVPVYVPLEWSMTWNLSSNLQQKLKILLETKVSNC